MRDSGGIKLIGGLSLSRIEVAELQTYARESDRLEFEGPQLISEVIAAAPRLVLLGEPGSGKSTALRYLALTLAAAALDPAAARAARLPGWAALGDQGRLLPIYLPLLPLARRLAEQPGRAGTADELWDQIAAHLEPAGAATGLAGVVHGELEAGHVLLLLDGLDEVLGADSRQKVVRAVGAFATAYPACRIVVACRVRAYAGAQNRAWQLPGWPTATLADWTLGQMTAFIDAWYGAAALATGMPAAKRDERRTALTRAVTTRADLQRLGVRPLLLTIMALVHLSDGRLPEERVSLYSRCLDILLGQWETVGKEDTLYGTLMGYIGLPDADVKSLRPLLSRAAFVAQDTSAADSLGRLGRVTLRGMVADELERLGHPDPHRGATRFLEYTDVRAGLLQASDAGDAYAFPHQTFQEYLAGLELVRGVEFVQRIMARRDDDRWRVPILLGVGHLVSEGALAMPYQLLGELLLAAGRTPERRQRDLLFAAEIAEDVGWDRLEQGGATFRQLRRDLAGALAEVLEGTVLPAPERVRAGVLLGALGDPRPGVCDLPPALVELPGGSFVIGSTAEQADAAGRAWAQYWRQQGNKELVQQAREWTENEINTQLLDLAPFAIGRYPVTNAQYAIFIAHDGYDPQAPWWQADPAGQRWLHGQRRHAPDSWDDERFGLVRPNHPVVNVSWYEASAFCRWLTQHLADGYAYLLPSEAEWEYAARGLARRAYPWGAAEPDGERANYGDLYSATSAVGCFMAGATPEGVLDLTGNVWEWTRSEYRAYPYDPHDGREDGSGPIQKSLTFRGGAWDAHPILLRAAYRAHLMPVRGIDHLGFRLARHSPCVKR